MHSYFMSLSPLCDYCIPQNLNKCYFYPTDIFAFVWICVLDTRRRKSNIVDRVLGSSPAPHKPETLLAWSIGGSITPKTWNTGALIRIEPWYLISSVLLHILHLRILLRSFWVFREVQLVRRLQNNLTQGFLAKDVARKQVWSCPEVMRPHFKRTTHLEIF
jgi:hypothetical protein